MTFSIIAESPVEFSQEDMLDVYVSKVIKAYQSSSSWIWECSEYTYNLYEEFGRYEREFTAKLCNALSVQKDTIYHWRKAWDLRVQILEANPNFDFGGLSVSHFYTASDYLDRLGVEAIIDWLEVAKEESWSVRKLSAEMATSTDDSGTPEWIMKKLNKILIKLEALYTNAEGSGLTNEEQNHIKDAILSLQKIV